MAAGFTVQNQANMARGRAPFAPRSERVGEREVFELDHIKALFRGGGTYDIDNLQIMTPRTHIEKSHND